MNYDAHTGLERSSPKGKDINGYRGSLWVYARLLDASEAPVLTLPNNSLLHTPNAISKNFASCLLRVVTRIKKLLEVVIGWQGSEPAELLGEVDSIK